MLNQKSKRLISCLIIIFLMFATIIGCGPEEEKEEPLTPEEKMALLEEVCQTIKVPVVINPDYLLTVSHEDPTVKITWSSDQVEIKDNGEIVTNSSSISKTKDILINLLLEKEEAVLNKSFYTNIANDDDRSQMTILDYPLNWDSSRFENVMIDQDNRLVLVDLNLPGSYTSDVIEVSEFKSLVGSFASITSFNSVVNLSFKVRVNGVWSSYLSYGYWGFGIQNKGVSATDENGIAKLSIDELIILNNQVADAIVFKVDLKSYDLITTPKLRLVSYALEYVNYQENVTVLPDRVSYQVPKLNQNIVPQIGNSICSPTSSTMLLKSLGLDFKEQDTYEHRYIAQKAYDYGHKIYGNWVFNVLTMGSFGFETYVARFGSTYELRKHLATVGPVAISVKGNMQNYYNTNGHLLVVYGYEIVDGQINYLCNDPNLANVEVKYSQETISNVWRKIAYVIYR